MRPLSSAWGVRTREENLAILVKYSTCYIYLTTYSFGEHMQGVVHEKCTARCSQKTYNYPDLDSRLLFSDRGLRVKTRDRKIKTIGKSGTRRSCTSYVSYQSSLLRRTASYI